MTSPVEQHRPWVHSPSRIRQKRSQVARACDWCRQRRIKCDNYSPCSNCKIRGRRCTNDAVKITTLPHAHREIETLRRQVEDLQSEIQQLHQKVGVQTRTQEPSPANFPTPELSVTQSICSDNDGLRRTIWGGIHFRTARSPNETWYGPSSLFYFIGRITNFLSLTLEQIQSKDQMVPDSASRRLIGPLASAEEDSNVQRFAPQTRNQTGTFLTPTQEEYFLDLYWNSYHTSLFPIINESEFKQHYQSLWTTSGNARADSALVDIVIALGMQYGISKLPNMRQQLLDHSDATIAGRWYYKRCQALLDYELESPTLTTLQCHLLCTIYLCWGSFQNMSDSTCAVAVRAAHMLGLHLDPPRGMPQQDREMRKRLWWTLYCLDSKIGIKLGRPFLTHQTKTSPSFPGDDIEVTRLSGSSFAPLGDNATWLTFNLQNTKLIHAAREAHTAFYGRDLNLQDGQTLWEDFSVLEEQAEFLLPFVAKLEEWTNTVPGSLTTKRKDGGHPFATDGTSLEIELFVPVWLQRQRILLELMYHNLCTNVFRPFISFIQTPSSTVAEEMAFRCARHSIALTNITHQALSTTSILSGWHESFQWQWNSAMTLVGFVLAYPESPVTVAARSAITLSVSVFDIFGESFPVAISAANIVRNLIVKIDFLAKRPWQKKQHASDNNSYNNNTNNNKEAVHQPPFPSNIMQSPHTEPYMGNEPMSFQVTNGSPDFDGMSLESMQDMFHMAFDIDEWSELNGLWSQAGI